MLVTAACSKAFGQACRQVPNPTDTKQVVIPVVMTRKWDYPSDDSNCPPELKEELLSRNCYPNPVIRASCPWIAACGLQQIM